MVVPPPVSGNTLVAVAGGANTVAVSLDDGLTWFDSNPLPFTTDTTYVGITADLNRFVLVTSPGKCAVSSDGITWVNSNMPPNLYRLSDVAWNGPGFCAIAYGNTSDMGTDYCFTSIDGMDWTPQFIADIGSSKYTSICVGADGDFVITAGGNYRYCLHSLTGATYTWAQYPLLPDTKFGKIVFGNGRYVIAPGGYGVGDVGSKTAYMDFPYSGWTLGNSVGETFNWKGLVYGPLDFGTYGFMMTSPSSLYAYVGDGLDMFPIQDNNPPIGSNDIINTGSYLLGTHAGSNANCAKSTQMINVDWASYPKAPSTNTNWLKMAVKYPMPT